MKEGQSFTLLAGIKINQKDRMMWYFDNICLAQRIGADNGETCTDDPCKERFLCRLKLDHQTGSLTITNTRTTDSGEYKLMITGNGNSSDQIIRVSVNSKGHSDCFYLRNAVENVLKNEKICFNILT